MANPIGPLGPADEGFNHQIPDTFSTVGPSDPSWTEKVCAMAAKRDGSLQLGFGLGKYTNRNVLDGYAGVSRGVEQATVRGSRRLFPAPDRTVVGPVRYEVLEPMKRIRFALEANECQPVSFDWVFEAVVPPALEERTHQRAPLGYRVSAELVRYHQIGLASGWVEVDGERQVIDRDEWVSTRDHSWGVRYDVGVPPTDTDPFNPDHPVAWAAVDRARSLAAGAGVQSAFATIAPPALFLFEPHQPELCNFTPNTFVDITAVMDAKRAAMAEMKAQSYLQTYYEQRAAQRGNHARRGSGQAGVQFAEAFQRMIPQVVAQL